ncbi:glycosyltransferase family 4 protein [Aliikangiella sp. IMCC44632]
MRKKILITATTFPLKEADNQPRFIYDLAKNLVPDFDVNVLVPHFPGAKKDEKLGNLKVSRYSYFLERFETLTYGNGILENLKKNKLLFLLIPFLLVAQYRSIYRKVINDDIRLINAHWIIPQGLIAILLKKRFKRKNIALKIVVTSHGGDLFALNYWGFNWLKRWVISNADKTVVVSEAMREYCYDAIKVKASCKIEVRSMGVDLQNTFVQLQPYKQREGLIFVGRIAEKKGLHVLIQAMQIVTQKYPNTQLTVVGEGSEKAFNQQLAMELSLNSNIEFKGSLAHSEIPVLLNQSRIFVMPSIVSASGDQEGLGLVAVEAMGCGCAVIASDLAAIKDVVIHKRTGIMFKAGSHIELGKALIGLLDDSNQCEEIAQRGHDYANINFDWSMVAKRYTEYFNEI